MQAMRPGAAAYRLPAFNDPPLPGWYSVFLVVIALIAFIVSLLSYIVSLYWSDHKLEAVHPAARSVLWLATLVIAIAALALVRSGRVKSPRFRLGLIEAPVEAMVVGFVIYFAVYSQIAGVVFWLCVAVAGLALFAFVRDGTAAIGESELLVRSPAGPRMRFLLSEANGARANTSRLSARWYGIRAPTVAVDLRHRRRTNWLWWSHKLLLNVPPEDVPAFLNDLNEAIARSR